MKIASLLFHSFLSVIRIQIFIQKSVHNLFCTFSGRKPDGNHQECFLQVHIYPCCISDLIDMFANLDVL